MKSMLRDKSNPLTRTSYLVMWALVFTTLGYWRSGTDPVNIPKLLILGAFAGLVLGNLMSLKLVKSNKLIFSAVGLFVVSLLVPLFFASAPMVQQLYGISGRNTGFLAYLFLAVLFLGAATFPQASDYQAIPRAILLAGYGSAAVCILEMLHINLMGANNIFGAIIGTLGNPNFVSAFSGMMAVGGFVLSFNPELDNKQRAVYVLLSITSLFLVIKSKSFQGLAATAIGVFLTLLLFVTYKKLKIVIGLLLSLGLVGTILFILGLLDKGPLASAIYQYTLPIRFQYWQAGLTMLKEHPFTGVGLNSYGDWYRSARGAQALIVPGPNVATNVAHNVYIDLASNGGLILLASFSLLFGITMYFSIKALISIRKFDILLVSTLMVWFTYLIQAFFSIDQLGVAIWGWVLGGAIVGISRNLLKLSTEAIDKNNKDAISSKKKSIERNATNAIIPQLIFFWLFVFAAFPAFKGDLDWAKARNTGTAGPVARQLSVWPQDEIRYSTGVYSFLNSNLEKEAVGLTEDGLKLFPRSSVLWNYLYLNPYSSVASKNLARERLIFLDPLNPAVLKLKKY